MKKLLLTVLMLSVIAPPAFAGDARIEAVKAEYLSQLKVSFVVMDAFKKDIEEAIHSGIPTSFTFIVRLYHKKDLWFAEELGTWRFNHTVKYDSLKEEYEVLIEEKNSREKTKDFGEVKRLMTTGTDVIVSPLPALKPGETYELMLKAKLDTVTLPSILNYMLFFVKLWDFETSWYHYWFTI
ncbi:MAG: DUF4390 domain-containing protein [Deltaproteobacteria bacterium]|nr:DUF4390 domain-containing protein [Deltaproteobacteria bacterium]